MSELEQQLRDLDAEFQAEAGEIAERFNAGTEELERVALKPKKTNIAVRAVLLAWAPVAE